MDRKMYWGVAAMVVFFLIGPLLPYIQDWNFFEQIMRIRMSTFLAIILGLSLQLTKYMWDAWKYDSKFFMSPGISASLSGDKEKDTEVVGEWTAIRLGGVGVEGFSFAGKEGTAFVHYLALEDMIEGTVGQAKMEETKDERLPGVVKKLAKKKELPRPYHLGTAPSSIEKQNKSYVEWKENWKQQNEGKNTIKSLLKDSFKLTRQMQEMKKLTADSKVKTKVQQLEDKIDSITGSEEE